MMKTNSDNEENKLKFVLTKRQTQAFEKLYDPLLKFIRILYGGAKGGGKSFLFCVWVVIWCRYLIGLLGLKENPPEHPIPLGFIGRKRSVDFTKTTLETFKKIIPSSIYRIRQQDKEIILWERVKIVYGGLDDTDTINKFNSAEYAFFGIDQAEETDKDDISVLRASLRLVHKTKDGEVIVPPYRELYTANPGACWLLPEFILNPEPDTMYVPALPSDNPHLPESYVKTLTESFKHRPKLLAAYLDGIWDNLGSVNTCIEPSWVETAKNAPIYGPVYKRIVTCDPAREGDDENVTYVMEQRQQDIAVIVDEHIEAYTPNTMQTAYRLLATAKQFDANLIAVDCVGIGAGICDRVEEILPEDDSIVLLRVGSGERKCMTDDDQKHFLNLKAKMWINAGRKFFDKKCHVINDSILCGQLSQPTFSFAENCVQKILGKKELKEKYKRSPDRGDNYVQGLYALDVADRLDQREYDDSTRDRQGHGQPMYEDVSGLHQTGGYY